MILCHVQNDSSGTFTCHLSASRSTGYPNISTVDHKTKVKMWCPAKVKRVADGEKDKGRDGQPLSRRAQKLAPRGMVLVEWEPDPEHVAGDAGHDHVAAPGPPQVEWRRAPRMALPSQPAGRAHSR